MHERHVGLTETTICGYSLFLSPKFVFYWAAKACRRFTIPHKLPFDHFYVHYSYQASGGSRILKRGGASVHVTDRIKRAR